jgi:hypothetical protein
MFVPDSILRATPIELDATGSGWLSAHRLQPVERTVDGDTGRQAIAHTRIRFQLPRQTQRTGCGRNRRFTNGRRFSR